MKHESIWVRGAVLGIGVALALTVVSAQPAPAPPAQDQHAPATASQPAAEHAATAEHGSEAEHGNPVLDIVAKLLNFSVLAGTLVYFLRSPLNRYLTDRGVRIRGDLVKAAEMKVSAAAQLAAVDQKMAALPAELDSLRRTGAEELAAEEARMRDAANRERERLLAQMQREITQRGSTAERELLRAAADRAIATATDEIARTVTPADHARLVDRYVATVKNQV